MINFSEFRENKELSLGQFAERFTKEDLRQVTEEMLDRVTELITDCTDADVVHQPLDPGADDPYAEHSDEADLAWNLGHLIVHTTASAEECAWLAAELARGVEWHGRSRSETPWQQITTMAQCQRRLAESRRMRLASLDLWPDQPNLENTHAFNSKRIGALNAVGYFIFGLLHDDGHLAQIEEVVRQAKEVR